MYLMEKKKLKQTLGDNAWELFKQAGVFVAGGAVTSVFCNREINDIDVYFRDEESMVRTVAAIFSIEEIAGNLFEITDSFEVYFRGTSQRTLMFTWKDRQIQFMTFKYFATVHEIFETFDFTVCMGAYDCAADEFVFHDEFLKHNSQRYLKFNPGTAYPIMSLMRVEKYREKGYMCSKSEMLRILAACMKLEINSWEDSIEHVGGMYGYDMSDAFDEDKPFSLDEMIDQLDTIHERSVNLFSLNVSDSGDSFWELCEKYWYHPEETVVEAKPTFDDSKYLYKCVDEDWVSPYASYDKKITYKQGDLIEVPEGGLYFHSHSSNPYYVSKYWVEAELFGGELRDPDQCKGYEKVVVKGGVVKIVRTFIHDHQKTSSKVENWMIAKYGVVDSEE